MKIEGKTSQRWNERFYFILLKKKKRIPTKFGFLVCWFIQNKKKRSSRKINFSTTIFSLLNLTFSYTKFSFHFSFLFSILIVSLLCVCFSSFFYYTSFQILWFFFFFCRSQKIRQEQENIGRKNHRIVVRVFCGWWKIRKKKVLFFSSHPFLSFYYF